MLELMLLILYTIMVYDKTIRLCIFIIFLCFTFADTTVNDPQRHNPERTMLVQFDVLVKSVYTYRRLRIDIIIYYNMMILRKDLICTFKLQITFAY